jgi:hypothetical protein
MKDVARVIDAPEPKVRDAAIDGKPGVMLMISSQYGANTLEVTDGLEKALDEMRSAIATEGMMLHDRIFRPANFIQSSIRNISQSLLVGAVLVAAVLFLFLFNVRTAFIALTAIPLSLLLVRRRRVSVYRPTHFIFMTTAQACRSSGANGLRRSRRLKTGLVGRPECATVAACGPTERTHATGLRV